MQRPPPEVEPTGFWPGHRSLLLSPAGLRHQPTPTEASISRQAPMWTTDTQSRSQSVSKTQNTHSPLFTSEINLHIQYLCYTQSQWIQVCLSVFLFAYGKWWQKLRQASFSTGTCLQTAACLFSQIQANVQHGGATLLHHHRRPGDDHPHSVHLCECRPSGLSSSCVTVLKHTHLVCRL